ncbi:COP9 signalosome complex subunit 5A, putative [Pediculus humanus corporis]|uniref:COP9 signalosome complex subunit 5A, putative n=1 Tax=Pediculus humanus subsp. corporis TaxID=121224 RepID=E0VJS2_PEDHC|nr:COP9 signalosome complex subunit 5A, putative [Pediculus humanus corporis]EEB13628.1 COP9 signalosome complex subunit 5A, putative [Pediculus humanus corporis]
MSLASVHMPADVYYACTLHALSVEEEEVMGLLIGKFEDGDAYIISLIILQRSDKRKDRVEISTEQLHSAMVKTSELSDSLGEPINVLGWYHSHPHITVQPSHVDLRTQASYQMMDNRFIGVIFSVFNVDKTKGQEIQVTCFQAARQGKEGPYEKVEVPLFVEAVKNFSTPCSESIFQLPEIISQEDLTNYHEISKSCENSYLNKLQNDSAFVISQCHILSATVNPLLLNAEVRFKHNIFTVKDLKEEKEKLLKLLKETSDDKESDCEY